MLGGERRQTVPITRFNMGEVADPFAQGATLTANEVAAVQEQPRQPVACGGSPGQALSTKPTRSRRRAGTAAGFSLDASVRIGGCHRGCGTGPRYIERAGRIIGRRPQ